MPRKKRITKKILFTKTVELLQPWMGLSDWKLLVKFSSRMKAAADCDASPEYKEALIRMNTTRFLDLTHYEIVSLAVHEMVHCITWQFAGWTEELCKKDSNKLKITSQFEEGLVTNLEKVIMNFAVDYLQEELSVQGYQQIDLQFTELEVFTDKQ